MLLSACGAPKPVTPPPAGDVAGLTRPGTPNSFLAAPAGFALTPDEVTRRYDVPLPRLLQAGRAAMAARPRTVLLAEDTVRGRADYVERSRVFGFPDIVVLQALAAGDNASALVVYSYSLTGTYDFGVNGTRVRAIVAAVDDALLAR